MPRLETPAGTDRYDAKLRHVFKESYTPDAPLRSLITGGLWESVVFVRGNEVCLLQTRSGVSVWDHEYRERILDGDRSTSSGTETHQSKSTWESVRQYENVPVSLDHYPLLRHSAPLPDDLLTELKAVWLDALGHAARNQSPRIGVDGGFSTYFLRTDDGRELAGGTWSPDKGPAAALREVTFALSQMAYGESARADLRTAISAYWNEARNRTPTSLELDHINTPLARRPSR